MRPILKDQVNYWSGKITWKESAEGCILGIKSLRNSGGYMSFQKPGENQVSLIFKKAKNKMKTLEDCLI